MFCPETCLDKDFHVCNKCDNKTCEAFFCLVVGSRNFDNYDLLKKKLDRILRNQKKVFIISGGAKGADTLAEKYAIEKGYYFKVFPADWNKHGKSAGYIRNTQMHDFISRFLNRGIVAFWDGKSEGTKQNFDLAKKYCTPIRIIRFDK